MSHLKRLALGKTLLTLCLLIVSGASTTFGQISAPSDGGNALLHGIGWQTFDNAGADNNTGISDNTPDSNSTFDATPVGSNNNGHYLTGVLGSGASVLGWQGYGQTTNRFFLNGATFGSNTVPDGLNIVDVPLADGSAGVRIGPQQEIGTTSAWKFRTNGNQEFGDFSITNESDFAFRLEKIHYDARSGSVNSPADVALIYLAAGTSNLLRADNGNEVNDLHVFSALNFAVQPNVRNITASVPGSLNVPTAVRLAPGDSASFRIRWTNAVTEFGEAQIDNLAISGTFLDQNNGLVPINPVDVVSSSILLGDVNTDGMVDFLDISSFITVLSGGVFQAEADCDESGVVDFLDISAFIALLSGP